MRNVYKREKADEIFGNLTIKNKNIVNIRALCQFERKIKDRVQPESLLKEL